jgi:hypothetical protein
MVSNVEILRIVRRRVLAALTVPAAVAVIAASLMITPAFAAAQSAKPDVYFVPDVAGQFRAGSRAGREGTAPPAPG